MPLDQTAATALIDGAVSFDVDHRRCLLGDEPMIFHCHHYNLFLQRTLRDAEYIDTPPMLVGAAAEVAHAQLKRLFAAKQVGDVAARKLLAQELFRWAGFGTLDLAPLSEQGGRLATRNSHYAMGWTTKWGKAPEPVSFFAAGWLAGALAAIHDKPLGAYAVHQTACPAAGTGEDSVFEITAGPANYEIYTSPGVGPLTDDEVWPVPANNVDYDGILGAVASMRLVGDINGNIPAFGVYLTRHYANYYNRISFEFLRKAMAQFGDEGREVAEPLLIEAGHVCAFNTFGGIMTSAEWDALIKPQLKTREDWVHGILAVANALGWGRWQVTELSPDRAVFVLHNDYESVGYLAGYGKSTFPVSYLAQGGCAGIMNLVYHCDITQRPPLTEAFYLGQFGKGGAFSAKPGLSLAKGDAVTTFIVTRD